jgi:integrase/recombinase XerD
MRASLEDFLWFLQGEKRFSKNSVEAYGSDILFWQTLGLDLNSESPHSGQFGEMVGKFDSTPMATSTRARRLATLRTFLKYRSLLNPKFESEWNHLLGQTPKVREDLPFPKSLTLSQIERFLNFAGDGQPEKSRNRALFEIIYASGLRISEALGLRWENVRREEELLLVFGKGSKERWVPTSGRALQWLFDYREKAWRDWSQSSPRKFRDFIFISKRGSPLTRMGAWKLFRARSLESGVDDVHPHVLRHSFATHLLQGGADVRAVQLLLGHQSLSTTERYLKIDDQELKKLFAEFHPLR